MGRRDEGGWTVFSSVLGELGGLSVLLLFRRVREEQPCGHQYLVSPGLDDVMLQEREGQVRRAECLISTHMCFMSGRHL